MRNQIKIKFKSHQVVNCVSKRLYHVISNNNQILYKNELNSIIMSKTRHILNLKIFLKISDCFVDLDIFKYLLYFY